MEQEKNPLEHTGEREKGEEEKEYWPRFHLTRPAKIFWEKACTEAGRMQKEMNDM